MLKKIKLIIAGSRTIRNSDNNLKNLTKIIEELNWEIDEIFCGKAKGVDSLGEQFALKNDIPIRYFPALWSDLTIEPCKIRHRKDGTAYNILAGHNRNEEMAKNADALLIIHKNTNGSLDMLKRAKKYNLLIKEIKI